MNHVKYFINNHLWPTNKMKDCSVGSPIQRVKAYEFNQSQVNLLIGPILNWIILVLLNYIGLMFTDMLSKRIKEFVYLSATFGIGFSICIVGAIILGVSYIILKSLNMKLSNCISKQE